MSAEDVIADLFAQAVAQGLHAPFSLNCESWGHDYSERLQEALHEAGYVVLDKEEAALAAAGVANTIPKWKGAAKIKLEALLAKLSGEKP